MPNVNQTEGRQNLNGYSSTSYKGSENDLLDSIEHIQSLHITSSRSVPNLNTSSSKVTRSQFEEDVIDEALHEHHSAGYSKFFLQHKEMLDKRNQIHAKVSEIVDCEKR